MIESSTVGKKIALFSLAVITLLLLVATAYSAFAPDSITRDPRPLDRATPSAKVPSDRTTATVSDAAQPDATTPSIPENKVRLVTAANFAGGGDCHDHFTDGCDLYSAVLDLSTGTVSEVTRLTSDPLGEAWPQIASDGKTAAFTRFASVGASDVMAVDLLTAASRRLAAGASNVSPMPDAASAIATSMPGFKLKKISLLETDQTFATDSLATNAHEPHVSADGSKVAYYATGGSGRGSGTAQAKILVLSNGTVVDASAADGSAHCFWGFDGTTLYCNNWRNGGVTVRSVGADGTVGKESVGISFPSVAEMAAVDPAYGGGACKTVSVQYGSFCDATRVALVAGCVGRTAEGEGEQIFSHAVLMDVTTGKLVPIGASMASAFGGTGTESWTTGCGPLARE